MKFPTKKSFVEWLSQRECEIVGIPDTLCDCPVARWLKDQGIGPYLAVGSCTVEFGVVEDDRGAVEIIDLPRWAQHFIANIDAIGNPTGTLGSTALNVLSMKGGSL